MILRDMTADDLPLFRQWLRAPHVAPWFEHPEDWVLEIEQQRGTFRWIHHFIAEADGVPVGFCQYYAAKDSDEAWLDLLPRGGTYSLDYLIGDAALLRRGLGRQMIERLTALVARLPDARRLAAQPDPRNAASRGLLRACGFAPVDPDGTIFLKEWGGQPLRGA